MKRTAKGLGETPEQLNQELEIRLKVEFEKRLAEEREKLAEERKRLAEERKKLAEEREKLAEEREKHAQELEMLNKIIGGDTDKVRDLDDTVC